MPPVGTLLFSRWCGGGLRRPFSRVVSSPLGLSLYFCLSTFVYAFPGYLRSRPIGRGALFFCLRLGRPSLVGGSAASFFSPLLRFCSPWSLLRGAPFLRARLSSRASVPRSGFPLRSPWGFFLLLVLLRFSSLLPGVPFFFVTSFLLVLLLSLYPLRFCSLLLGTSFFALDFLMSCRSISLYFFIYFYLFRFVRLKNCGRGA